MGRGLVSALVLSLGYAKELGLHKSASEEYREHIHRDIMNARVRAIESDFGEDHGEIHWHAYDPAIESAYKHLTVIKPMDSSPRTAAIRVLADEHTAEDGSHPMNSTEAVLYIWVKDQAGDVVFVTEFDDKHEKDQKAHSKLDLAPFQTAERDGNPVPRLTPYAYCVNHGVASIWEGRPFDVPQLLTKDEL